LDGIRFGNLEDFFDDKLVADDQIPSKKTQNRRKKTYKQILQKILGQFKTERSKIYFFDGYSIPELQVIFKLAVYQKEQILKKLKKLESFLDFGRDSVELKILDINIGKIQIKHFQDHTNNLTGYTYLLEILGSKNLVSEGNYAVDKSPQSFAVCKSPQPFAVCKSPQPFSVCKSPQPFAVCKSPQPFAVCKSPQPFAVDKSPQPFAVDKSPQPFAVDKSPQPFAVDKSPQPFAGWTQTSLPGDYPSPPKPYRPYITNKSIGVDSQNEFPNPSRPSRKS
jgi:hypothetical protein